MKLVSPHAVALDDPQRNVYQRDGRCVAINDFLRLEVELLAPIAIEFLFRSDNQFVKALVAISRGVVSAVTDIVDIEELVEEIIRIVVVAAPTGQRQLMFASAELLKVRIVLADSTEPL